MRCPRVHGECALFAISGASVQNHPQPPCPERRIELFPHREDPVRRTKRLPHSGFDYEAVYGACAEMVVGYVPLPVGVAGPLLLNGTSYQVPLATVEGALIASTRRGCKAITESGGAAAAVLKQGMTRAPVLLFPSAMRASEFAAWLGDEKNLRRSQATFATTIYNKYINININMCIAEPGHLCDHLALRAADGGERRRRLRYTEMCTHIYASPDRMYAQVSVAVAGKHAYARFACSTGDAMGMNMVSKGVSAVLDVDLIYTMLS